MIELNDKIYWAREEIGQKKFKNWLEQTRDWSLSRNRNFGTPIPIWQTEDGEETIVIGSIQELVELAGLSEAPTDLHTQHVDNIVITSQTSGKPMKRIKDVFDCVTGNTQISLGNGRNICITNMYNHLDTNVMSFKNTKNFKNITQSICNAFIEKGNKQCIEIILEDGRTLECTQNHKILTYENNEYVWKQAQQLITGVSRIVTSIKYPEILNLNNVTESHWQLSCKNMLLKYDTYADKIKSMTFARLLGYILTDGSFHNHTTTKTVTGTFLIANILDAQLVANDVNLLCGINPNIKYDQRSNLHLINVPKQLLDSFINLEGIQIGRRINKKATLPQFILDDNCPIDIVREFLSGLFGGDGITPRVSTSICKKTKTTSYKFIGIKFVSSKTETYINSLVEEYNNIIKLFNKIGINNIEISKPYQTSTSKKQLNSEKKYQLLLTISNPKDILIFHKYVGFAYCLQKQMRLEICASWRNMQECLSNKRNEIFQQIMTHINNGLTRRQAYDIISIKYDDLQNIMTFNQVSNCLRANTNVTQCLSNILLKDWLISINALDFFFDDTLKKGKNMYVVKNTDTYIPSFNLLVTNKTPIGIKKVYDLSVESTHAFIANGMVIHNCWFESGAVPFAKLHYPFENSTYFDNKEYLSDFVAEGLDQTRGWFYTLLVLSTALFDKPPFKHCICSGLILDEHGVKFSKKFGNFIDPNLLLEEYGADVLRLYLEKSPLSNAQELFFKLTDVKDVAKKLIPYTNGISFFIDHLKNAYKSNITNVSYIGDDYDYSLITNVTDKWILERISTLRELVETHMEEYHVDKPVLEILNFIEDLTNWYIKFNRSRMKGKFGEMEQSMSLSVLYTAIYDYSLISAPFMPFLSEHIYQQLKVVVTQQSVLSVHMLRFPTVYRNFGIEQSFKKLQTLCWIIRGIRDSSTTHRSTKVPIESCVIFEDDSDIIDGLKDLLEVIQEEVNCDKFEFKPVPEKTYCLKPNFKVLGKKYKKDTQKACNVIASVSSAGIEEYVEQGGGILGIIDNDHIYEFAPDEFEVVSTKLTTSNDNPNVILKECDGLMLAIDLTISEEGNERYLVKCFSREVQNIRKQMGLKQWDKVAISYSTQSELLKNSLSKHHDKLLQLSDTINFEDFTDGNVCNIDEYVLNIKINAQV
jgi:valyl-tRNA synthetase